MLFSVILAEAIILIISLDFAKIAIIKFILTQISKPGLNPNKKGY
jgi:hypothetical protein